MKRRTLLAALAAAPALPILSACGGGVDEGTVSLRLVNASTGYDELDLYLDDDRTISDVPKASCSGSENVTADNFSASLRSGDSGIRLASLDVDFSSDKHYTLVAYGAVGSLQMILLSEDESDGEDGYAKLRVFNAATDAGVLDVLIGAAGGGIEPAISDNEVGKESEFFEIGEGSKRIAVAPPSDSTDLRFNVDGVRLREGQVATLVLAPITGGSLVNALLITERGDVETFANNQSRLRVIAGLAGGSDPRVAVSSDGVAVATAQVSASVGNYKLINAGGGLTITANGLSVAAPAENIAAGGDYSLVVYGSASDPVALLLADDNRAPSGESKTRIRSVHASFLDAGATMSVDIDADNIQSGIGYAESSSYASVDSTSSDASIDVTVGTTPVAVPNQALQAGATYTLFLLNSGEATRCILRLDLSTS